ncbi:MAG: c-type cytochrome, partial [Halieaceae bacterium]
MPLLVVFLTLSLLSPSLQAEVKGLSPGTASRLESARNIAKDPAEETHPGASAYQAHCAACHDQPFYKAPSRQKISRLDPRGILRTMNDGVMRPQAAAVAQADRQAIAEYLTGKLLADYEAQPLPPACDADHGFDPTLPPVSRGWGVDERNTRFQPEDTGGLTA